MIGETRLSYQLSRWAFLALLVLAIPLLCIPVRAQEKGCVAPPTPAACDAVVSPAADTDDKKEELAKTVDATEPQAIDPKIKELGEAVLKRISTYSDEETLTLKEGETGRMKVKKNLTPVAEILITPHFVEDGMTFDLDGADATGNAIEGTTSNSGVIHNAATERMGLGKQFSVGGENIFCKIQLHPTRQDDNSIAVEVKVLFARMSTTEEIKAMLLSQGKSGQLQLNFQEIGRLVMEYQQRTGHYPKHLAELNKALPKDVYSPTGEGCCYEAQRSRFILSSCGLDGIYGNDDDEILIYYSGGARSGQRHELYPLEKEREVKVQPERVVGVRPQGNCSISGKVVSAETGEPVDHARMYLHYKVTYGSIFINTASDGTFKFENIPKGPFSLQSSHTAGYQDVAYDPDGKAGQFPEFSLEDGEQRSGIVLTAKRACSISGKVLDENGEIPKDIKTLCVWVWFKNDDGEQYKCRQMPVNEADGSYMIDGLSDKPVYVMALNWRAAHEGKAYPPVYYPSTFSRSDAELIAFDKSPHVEGINITLRKEGGLIIEGTVRDEAGNPIPEAFVVVHRRDMLFDCNTAYTDEQGRYQIQGFGDGEFLVHVDAVHRGFVRMRTPVDLAGVSKRTRRDFTLAQGVTISGKLVDEQGKDWQIGESSGHAHIMTKDPQEQQFSSFGLFWNKYRPKDASARGGAPGGAFAHGEGGYADGAMLFPTTNTFVVQGMMPGQTMLSFYPQKERQRMVKILHEGRDIMKSGFETEAGQEITDVTIVIGPQ